MNVRSAQVGHKVIPVRRTKEGIPTVQTRRRWADKAVKAFQAETGTEDGNAICDLVCDLMHLADGKRYSALEQVRRGIYHWYAETHHEAYATIHIDTQPERS